MMIGNAIDSRYIVFQYKYHKKQYFVDDWLINFKCFIFIDLSVSLPHISMPSLEKWEVLVRLFKGKSF